MDRRELLRWGAGGSLAAVAGAATSCAPEPAPPDRVFAQGVASGLHSDTEVVLWSRAAPERSGGTGDLLWEVATDETFSGVVANGTVHAGEGSDHTVKVLVGGLAPDRSYAYRFRHPGEDSPVGRARTLPAPGAQVSSLRLAFASCQAYDAGYYTAWREVARSDLDAVLFLGDYIYESPLVNLLGSARSGDTFEEATTLEGYRAKYRIYKADPDLRAAHAAHPFVPIWDDHEVANDYDARIFAQDPARVAGAYRAWFEYQPVWPSSGTRIHRDLGWGDLGHVFMLDGRQYRDAHRDGAPPVGVMPITRHETEPGRSLLGDQQRKWLLDGLSAASTASTWKIIGNPVMIAPRRVLDLDFPELRAANPDHLPHAGLYTDAAFDSWDGFVWERRQLLGHLADAGVSDTVFVTGDYHSFWQAALVPDFDDGDSPVVANEFAAGAVSSGGGALNENLLFGGAHNGPYQPGFNFVDGSHNGYGVLEADHGAMTVTFLAHDARSSSAVPTPRARFTLEAGDPTVATERL